MTTILSEIWRFPVKGLSGERLERIALTAGRRLPGDRRFAIAHGATQYDPAKPGYLPPHHFLMLKKNERLAQLRTEFGPDSGKLTLLRDHKAVVSGDLESPLGRAMIGQFLAAFMGRESRGAPRIVDARDGGFTDVAEPWVSIINMASVRDLERVTRSPVDPRRFRGNLYIDGAGPWTEFGWVGQEITIGAVRLRVHERIERCAATNVNPDTAERDLNLPLTLRNGFGHMDCGVYCEVLNDGEIVESDALTVKI